MYLQVLLLLKLGATSFAYMLSDFRMDILLMSLQMDFSMEFFATISTFNSFDCIRMNNFFVVRFCLVRLKSLITDGTFEGLYTMFSLNMLLDKVCLAEFSVTVLTYSFVIFLFIFDKKSKMLFRCSS